MTQGNSPFGPFVERNSRGRRFVVSDIHGCSRTLNTLFETIGLRKEDQLFLLGDYIDRGPDSGGVLAKILHLMASGYQIYPLRGNHEQYLLEASQYYSREEFKRYVLEINECTGVLTEEGTIIPLYQDFIESLPFFYELDNFYLVHAGFNFRSPDPFRDYRSMIEMRNFHASPSQIHHKRVVYGHQVTPLRQITDSVDQHSVVIPLDNGCCFAKLGGEYRRVGQVVIGNLCCLELDTLTLTIQPNVDYS